MTDEQFDGDSPEGGGQGDGATFSPGGSQIPEDVVGEHGSAEDQAGQAGQEDAWYYSAGGVSYGPVAEAQLVALAKAGHFRKEDYVYAAYIGEWVRADSVHGLFDDVGAGAVPAAQGELYVPPPGAPVRPVIYTSFAGFWIRFLAVFIDGLILGAAGCIIAQVMNLSFALGTGTFRISAPLPNSPSWPIMAAWVGMAFTRIAITTAMGWLYYAFMESSRWQATLGKRAVGVMVTDMEGKRITFGRATGRYFASWLSGWLTLMVGYIMGAFTERKQTLHDLIVDTVVVYGKSA